MCLDKISKKKPNPEGKGWKVFFASTSWTGRGLMAVVYSCGKTYPLNKWIHQREFYPGKDSDKGDGFYIFKKKRTAKFYRKNFRDTKSYTVRRVHYRKAHTQGSLYDFMHSPTIIADEMMICAGKERVGSEDE